MKERFLIAVNVILAIVLVFMGVQLYKGKQEVLAEKQKVETVEGKNVTYKEAITNPIDLLFAEALGNAHIEVTYRALQELYYNTWKTQYDNIMEAIRKKCQYDEDIANYDSFIKEVERETEDGFHKKEPLILNAMLDNFEMPESPEKHSYGNGTNYRLLLYKGTMYRNACMFFVPSFDEGEYSFPIETVKAEINKILEDKYTT